MATFVYNPPLFTHPLILAHLETIAAFDEYLGFFELLAHLWKQDRFEVEDIDGLFGYYILDAYKKEAIKSYLEVDRFRLGVLEALMEAIKQRNDPEQLHGPKGTAEVWGRRMETYWQDFFQAIQHDSVNASGAKNLRPATE